MRPRLTQAITGKVERKNVIISLLDDNQTVVVAWQEPAHEGMTML